MEGKEIFERISSDPDILHGKRCGKRGRLRFLVNSSQARPNLPTARAWSYERASDLLARIITEGGAKDNAQKIPIKK